MGKVFTQILCSENYNQREAMGLQNYNRRRGIALIMTLLVLTVLVVIVGQFSYSSRIEACVAENCAGDLQNRYALLSAIELAIAQLQLDAMQEEGSASKGNEKQQQKYDSFEDVWANGGEENTIPLGEDIELSYSIKDENSKFNLLLLAEKKEKEKGEVGASAGQKNEEDEKDKENEDEKDKAKKEGEKPKSISPPEQFIRIIQLTQGDKATISAKRQLEIISDWIKNRRSKSAEEFPKELPLLSLKELFLAKGMTSEVLFGFIDRNGEEVPGLLDNFTVWSDGKININTASAAIIQSLSAKIDGKLAEAIVAYRDGRENDGSSHVFKELDDLKKVPELKEDSENGKVIDEIKELLTVKSNYFSIKATVKSGRMRKKIHAIVYRDGKNVHKLFCEFE